jgi:hypothetical protein
MPRSVGTTRRAARLRMAPQAIDQGSPGFVSIPPLPALITLRAGDVLFAYGYRTDARGMIMPMDFQTTPCPCSRFFIQSRGTIAFSQSFN